MMYKTRHRYEHKPTTTTTGLSKQIVLKRPDLSWLTLNEIIKMNLSNTVRSFFTALTFGFL